MRRVLDHAGVSLVSVGIRAISKAEVEFYEANRDRIAIHWAKDQARWDIEAIVAPLPGRPVYVTFDIDALDAAVMPATGTPTPGGLGYWQALAILRRACAVGQRGRRRPRRVRADRGPARLRLHGRRARLQDAVVRAGEAAERMCTCSPPLDGEGLGVGAQEPSAADICPAPPVATLSPVRTGRGEVRRSRSPSLRNVRRSLSPRIRAAPHTRRIPLHSRGRRTREASHGEGGLQAAGGVTHLAERGSASQPGCNARSQVIVKCDAQAKNPARGGEEPLIR